MLNTNLCFINGVLSDVIEDFDFSIFRKTLDVNKPEHENMYWYHKDHLASSTQITDRNETVIHHIEYMPSGEQFSEQRDNWATPYKFNGKELDAETGLYYYGARYYTPEIGIWLSVDPLSDKYPSLSPYAYCANNPVMLIDPDGREIVNAYEKTKNQAEAKMNDAKTRFESFDGNKKSDGYKQAKREYNKSKKEFNKVNDKFEMVSNAISDVEKYNNSFFNELNNLEDKNGQCVDVYVEIGENMKTNRGKSVLGSSPSPKYNGTNFVSNYGLNTTTVEIDKSTFDKGAILAHEGGHKVVWIKAYESMLRWYSQPSARDGNGHDKGNPSGDYAKRQEDIYLNNKPRR